MIHTLDKHVPNDWDICLVFLKDGTSMWLEWCEDHHNWYNNDDDCYIEADETVCYFDNRNKEEVEKFLDYIKNFRTPH